MAKSFTVEMTHTKDTKNTVVYGAESTHIPQLYIQKAAFDGTPPKAITVVVTEA